MSSTIGVQNIAHTNGTNAMTVASDGDVTFANRYPQTAIIADTKSQNTAGGTFTSGAWRTRTLNTEVSDLNNICSLSSDIFTLSSGTYLIEWIAPAYNVNRHQTRLYDTTNSSVIQYGGSNYANSSNAIENSSSGSAIVVISSNTGYKIEHQCGTTSSTQGLGVEANMGTEVYTQVKITKIG